MEPKLKALKPHLTTFVWKRILAPKSSAPSQNTPLGSTTYRWRIAPRRNQAKSQNWSRFESSKSQKLRLTQRSPADNDQIYSAMYRHYRPGLGRWLKRDPIGFSGGQSNLYGYVGNRPTAGTDLTGLYFKAVKTGAKLTFKVPLIGFFGSRTVTSPTGGVFVNPGFENSRKVADLFRADVQKSEAVWNKMLGTLFAVCANGNSEIQGLEVKFESKIDISAEYRKPAAEENFVRLSKISNRGGSISEGFAEVGGQNITLGYYPQQISGTGGGVFNNDRPTLAHELTHLMGLSHADTRNRNSIAAKGGGQFGPLSARLMQLIIDRNSDKQPDLFGIQIYGFGDY